MYVSKYYYYDNKLQVQNTNSMFISIKTVTYPNKYLKLLFNHLYFIILSDDYILRIVIRFSDNDNHGKYENTETR